MKLLTVLMVSGLALAWTGCRKDDLKINDPGTESHLSLRFRFMHGARLFSLDSTYTDGFGTKVRFTTVRFLLNSATALQEQGFEQGSWPGAWCLADASTPDREWPLGIVKTGNVHFLRTTTGLNAEQERLSPDQFTSCATMSTMLACAPDSGYAVLVLEGRLDADGDGEVGPSEQPFVIRCTSNSYHKALLVHAHTVVQLLHDAVIDLRVDVSKLLQEIDLPDEPSAIGAGIINDQVITNLTQGALGDP